MDTWRRNCGRSTLAPAKAASRGQTRSRAPVELETEPAVLRGVLASSTDAIVLVDTNGTVVRSSDAAQRMFGTLRDRSLEGPFERLFAPESREPVLNALCGQTPRKRARATAVAVRRDGSRLIVEVTCSSVRGGDGGTSGHVVVLRDVTEPMLVRSAAAAVAFEPDASAALESFAHVLRRVVPVDHLTLTAVEDGHARRVASAGRCAGSLRSGELVPLEGSDLAAAARQRRPIVRLDTRTRELPHDEVLAEAGVRSYVVLPLFHAGRVVATLNVGFATVGAPKRTVVELLGSLTASIMPIVLNLVTLEEQAGAIQRLEGLDALKNEFLALITHDIRTPLAVIAGFAERLQNRWNELPDGEKLEGVDAILRNGRNLNRLVEEGLQVARIESGDFSYDLRAVALEEEVQRSVADLAAAGAERIRVSAENGLPPVRCDPDRHWQILTNLLSNALKFSPPARPVEVALTRRGRTVQVAVRDYGPGIERADLPKLFQKFSRVGGREQLEVRGTGLGLYLSKAMVEAQGGRIWVESEPGRGSTFVYALPVAEPVGV